MKKVAIYIRVSTQEQAKEGFSIEAQKDRLVSYCKAKGWNIYNIYVDGGFSGSNMDRPALKKLLNEINNVDMVLVYKLDRISRSQKDTLYLIEEKFLPNNVDFVSLQESFDTSTPFGRAMIGILSVFAQLERETIVERAKMGKLERAKQGLYAGNGNSPIGYNYNPDTNTLEIDEYEALQIKEMFNLYLKGYGCKRIGNALDKKGYRHKYGRWNDYPDVIVIRALKNPVYIGKIRHLGEIYEGQHEAIVDELTFQKAQSIMTKRSSNMNSGHHQFLLNGLLYCSKCSARILGNVLFGRRRKDGTRKEYKYYNCYSVRKWHKSMVKDHDCNLKTWRKDDLENAVLEKIKAINFDKKSFENMVNRDNPNNIEIKDDIISNKIKELDKQIDKLMDLYQNDKIPANIISARIEKLYNEKKSLEQATKEVAATKEINEFDIDEIYNIIQNFDLIWKETTFEEKKLILDDLIDKIIVYDDKINVKFNFEN